MIQLDDSLTVLVIGSSNWIMTGWRKCKNNSLTSHEKRSIVVPSQIGLFGDGPLKQIKRVLRNPDTYGLVHYLYHIFDK